MSYIIWWYYYTYLTLQRYELQSWTQILNIVKLYILYMMYYASFSPRYHYFLQLKSDIIDGKLHFNIEQAISLAAYSLQAEFGDYDPERHTVEYLRDFAILPKVSFISLY